MYYFAPMMPLWGKLITADTAWLMSGEGRRLIAKTIWHCRRHHGAAEARRYWHGLIVVGVIYPRLLPKVD